MAALWSAQARRDGASIGFVPTMGALHEGHIDLIRRALQGHDRVVCSIFVNPLQFTNEEDFARYPNRLAQDQELLAAAGCHALFKPQRVDLFQDFVLQAYDLGGLDAYWEGPSRPGHFQGVVNVVQRLFSFVRPDSALFGEKDRQQLAIIQHVAQHERWPERILACPTLRASDGLALSSRNLRLNTIERQRATALYKALQAAAETAFKASVEETTRAGTTVLGNLLGGGVDYFGIAHPRTLVPLIEWGDLEEAVAVVAAQVGPVRLIDNLTLTRGERPSERAT
ncbi:MAG: pantoate--beta-alanine ligase [Flavobacteriales bacterium]|nr:pantoate--beta-alanine ligase [Flavobacteriales bacterium]